jgi:asparagine synthase (glutamine-hydrolysing)
MPGIVGLLSPRPPAECQRLVEQMLGCMQHETFYTSGSYSAPDLGVFAGWVALEGSFSDCQPILSERGDVALLFSGECFSRHATGVELDRSDHRRELDNAEWLVQLYEQRGDHFFTNLNGLFSGLLIDKRQRKVFLFNDRYGMERIYYHEHDDDLFFASEAKALLRILPQVRAFDNEGVAQVLTFGCTLESRTLFRDVYLLPGASLWTFEGRQWTKNRYFAPATWESQPALPTDSFEAQFQETFRRILPCYFSRDSDLGISLTGGLDTRMIMAYRPKRIDPLACYTFGGEADTVDVRLAARVASACNLPHQVLRIGQAFLSQLPSLADRTVYITDGCLGICGAHEIYLNNQARALAPIRLTGNFGGEILRGVTTFKPVGLSATLFAPDVAQPVSHGKHPSPSIRMHPVSFAAFREIPWLLFGLARAAQSQIITRTPFLDNDLVALTFQSPERLRRSPSPALRLIRQADAGLDRIPTDRGLIPASPFLSLFSSFYCRTAFKLDYWLNEGMPHWLSPVEPHLARINTRPWPFGLHRYLRYPHWFRKELASYVRERLTDPQTQRSHLWNRTFLNQIAESHIAGRKNYVREIDTILTFAGIDRLLLNQTTARS